MKKIILRMIGEEGVEITMEFEGSQYSYVTGLVSHLLETVEGLPTVEYSYETFE